MKLLVNIKGDLKTLSLDLARCLRKIKRDSNIYNLRI